MGVSWPYVANIPLAPRNTWYALSISTVLPYDIRHLIPIVLAYYAIRDQDEKGKNMLRRVYGKVPGYDVEQEYAIIKNTLLEEKQKNNENEVSGFRNIVSLYLMCFQHGNLKRTIGAAAPICAQQLTGLSFLSTYASLFFRQSGFDNAFLITTIMSEYWHWNGPCRYMCSHRYRLYCPCGRYLSHGRNGYPWSQASGIRLKHRLYCVHAGGRHSRAGSKDHAT